jgi:CRISPR-associated protein Csd2
MFEEDHAAARGKMATRKLIIFKHEGILGNVPSHKLFERVKIEKVCTGAPRSYKDYQITIDKTNLTGVEIIEK